MTEQATPAAPRNTEEQLVVLVEALKAGEQVVKPDPTFGPDSCHGFELYHGTLYLKGVGSACGDQRGEWLLDLMLHPDEWMTWTDFSKHNVPVRRAASASPPVDCSEAAGPGAHGPNGDRVPCDAKAPSPSRNLCGKSRSLPPPQNTASEARVLPSPPVAGSPSLLCGRVWPGVPAIPENEHKCGLMRGHDGPCLCARFADTGPCGAMANKSSTGPEARNDD